MAADVDELFRKRVWRYLLVLTAVGVVLPGLIFVPLSRDLGLSDYLYNVPGTLGVCFALSWAAAYHRQYAFPEAFGVLKAGAVWTAVWLAPGMAIGMIPKAAAIGASDGDLLIGSIFVFVFAIPASSLIMGFALFLVSRVWPRK